jgi:predicted O-linked N-acetylglucosamine transferase (SPINDLY family)
VDGSFEVLQMRGIAQHRLGQRSESRATLERAVEQYPDLADGWKNLGVLLREQGHLDGSLAALMECTQRALGDAVAWNHLGFVQLELNNVDASLRSLRTALALDPSFAEAHFNLGNAVRARGDMAAAIGEYRAAIRLQPQYLEAQNNLGTALLEIGEAQSAIDVLESARKYSPHAPTLLVNLAGAYQSVDRLADAAEMMEKLVKVRPNLVEPWFVLGNIYRDLKQPDVAVEHYGKALTRAPDHIDAAVSRAGVFQDLGDWKQARFSLESLDHPGAKINAILSLPTILPDGSLIDPLRAELRQSLEALQHHPSRLDNPLREGGTYPFYIAYHGRKDRDLMDILGDTYRKLTPSLAEVAPHIADWKVPSGRIRVGIASAFLRSHTIGKLFAGLVERIDREKFEVIYLQTGGKHDAVSASIASGASQYHRIRPDLDVSRHQIAGLELDALFYPEIGMDAFTYFLSFSRLAPFQWLTWGHPATTGSNHMDAFFSSESMETPGGDAHYGEKLVRLRHPGTWFDYPDEPSKKSRGELGLPDDSHLYSCPQTLFKIHPDFDSLLQQIVQRDSRALLVFLSGKHSTWDELLRKRWERTAPELVSRTVFLPALALPDYLRLMQLSDVVLDPIHFGGGNSTLEGLAVGAPIVSLPGDLLRNRITYALYEKMGYFDLIVHDGESYVDLAIRIATEPDFRRYQQERIEATRDVLYRDDSVVRDWEDAVISAVKSIS